MTAIQSKRRTRDSRRSLGVATRALGLSALAGWAVLAWPASAATQYTGVYGGGPIYKSDTTTIPELNNSGFTEVIVWSVHVDTSGNLNLNGEFPLTSNGVYVGNSTYPNFPSDMATLKSGNVKRITFSVGSGGASDFANIKSLIAAQGTGSNSILYKDFQALKAAIPSIDAIDFDDESTYDSSSSSQFAEMLGTLGYHVTISPYTNSSYWTSLVSTINNAQPGLVDGVHLQVYSGGAGNDPCSTGGLTSTGGLLSSPSWNFGSVPVFPGLWDSDVSPEQGQTKWQGWANQCGITGGFLWLYDDVTGKTYNGYTLAQAYAGAINNAVAANIAPQGTATVSSTYSDGSTFITGGMDGGGTAYSSNQLGSSVAWNGTTFALGQPNTANAWTKTTIAPASDKYNRLSILATAVNGNQPSQTFTVNYADGTSTTIDQSVSDWGSAQGYPGESTAATTSHRNIDNGTSASGTFNLYGYSFVIDGSKNLQSFTLPGNRNVVMLAYSLAKVRPVTTQVDLSSAFNRAGIYADGSTFLPTGGVDGAGDAYSGNLLGSSVSYNGVTYSIGAPAMTTSITNNVVSASGQTIALPLGQFSTLELLATAVRGSQTGQTFTVNYTDGSSTAYTQSLSDWMNPQNFASELDAVQMGYSDTSLGGKANGIYHVYNYSLPLNKHKSVQSVTLPNDQNVEILAIDLAS